MTWRLAQVENIIEKNVNNVDIILASLNLRMKYLLEIPFSKTKCFCLRKMSVLKHSYSEKVIAQLR